MDKVGDVCRRRKWKGGIFLDASREIKRISIFDGEA